MYFIGRKGTSTVTSQSKKLLGQFISFLLQENFSSVNSNSQQSRFLKILIFQQPQPTGSLSKNITDVDVVIGIISYNEEYIRHVRYVIPNPLPTILHLPEQSELSSMPFFRLAKY